MHIRIHAVRAVLKRNFKAYFGSPTGYVFITAFILATAFVAFYSQQFFASNMADLATLNAWMPWLLVVFVPAITMGSWAEERKLGTAELLLTLPVTDLEVILGKYLAALAVYTVSLLFAISHGLVLQALGGPDWGLLAGNYLGYWLLGAGLIPLALVASVLTSNVTVAFILGTALCAAAVFIEQLAVLVLGPGSRLAQGLGIPTHFENFTLGVVALPDIVFFVLMAATVLYIAMVVIGRRHWLGGRNGPALWPHFLIRSVSVIVAAVAIALLAGRWLDGARADTTSESINSPSPQTLKLLGKLPGQDTVFVRAYVSPDVPEDFVPIRQTVLRFLRVLQTYGGGRIVVEVNEAEPYTPTAREAQELFGISPRTVRDSVEGRQTTKDIFLAVGVTCGPRQQVIPFFDKGLSVEYELVHAISTAAKAERRKVGILRTEAQMTGGFDPRSGQTPPWQIVDELRKQYEIVDVDPGSQIKPDIDVLIAAQPTGLPPEQLTNLEDYVLAGHPTLLLVDPFPVTLATGPYPPPTPNTNLSGLLGQLGLRWDKDRIACDTSVRIEGLPDVPETIVFASSSVDGLNKHDPVTADLTQVALLFGGALDVLPNPNLTVVPLMQTGTACGLVESRQFMMSSRRYVTFTPSDHPLMLAARVTGSLPSHSLLGPMLQEPTVANGPKANAIVVADVDLIADTFFSLRRSGEVQLRFDNIAFLLNCVDSLAGDNDMIALRSRHPGYHLLTRINDQRTALRKDMEKEQKAAETAADEELKNAQERFDQAVAEIEKRPGLDEQTKEILTEQVRKNQQSQLDASKAKIDDQRERQVSRAKEEMMVNVRGIENRARGWAILLTPMPAVLLGIAVFAAGWARERRGIPLARSMRQTP